MYIFIFICIYYLFFRFTIYLYAYFSYIEPGVDIFMAVRDWCNCTEDECACIKEPPKNYSVFLYIATDSTRFLGGFSIELAFVCKWVACFKNSVACFVQQPVDHINVVDEAFFVFYSPGYPGPYCQAAYVDHAVSISYRTSPLNREGERKFDCEKVRKVR